MSSLLIYNARIISLQENGVIERGYILIEDGRISSLQEGVPGDKGADEVIDAKGMVVMPSLTDCHTHLLEYATLEVFKTRGKAQKMAGIANLLTALTSGITHLGEHHLGHPLLDLEIEEYREITRDLPLAVKLSYGSCFLGTDPLCLLASTRPGQTIGKEALERDDYLKMAACSDFAGENLFLTATVANLPLSAVSRAGEITYTYEELERIVEIFHSCGKKVGAHIEGDQGVLMFLEAGGDIIHHGHNIKESTMDLIAEKQVPLVVTPHGGTGAVPTSPQEALALYSRGVKLALASDSYLPVHPGASWIHLPPGYLAGPRDFLAISSPLMRYLWNNGVPLEEVLALITSNGREILSNGKERGILSVGETADLIIAEKIPALETTSCDTVRCVVREGEVLFSTLQQ